ncbi:MAG TPA: LysE family translocator [Terriglobia bacterium]|nr:LysE family translocator [Terriglobia bacterium]
MPDPKTITLFVLAALVLLLTPGPAVLYIVARSIDGGRKAGIVSTLGIGVGTLFHVTAAALGVSALLVSSALAFNTVKYLGAAYLIYLGAQKLLRREEASELQVFQRREMTRVFTQGILVNLLNPKTALFFFAFLPQFVDVSRGPVAAQVLFFGMLLVLMGLVSDGLYAVMAGTAGEWVRANSRFLRAQRYFSGGLLITLGVAAAFTGSDRSK